MLIILETPLNQLHHILIKTILIRLAQNISLKNHQGMNILFLQLLFNLLNTGIWEFLKRAFYFNYLLLNLSDQ